MSTAQAKASAALRIPQNLGAQQLSGQVGGQQNELSHNGIARASGDVKVCMVTGWNRCRHRTGLRHDAFAQLEGVDLQSSPRG